MCGSFAINEVNNWVPRFKQQDQKMKKMKEILEKKENEFKETEIKYMMELDKATDEVLKMKKQAKDLEEIKAQKSTTSDHNYYHDEPLQKKSKFSVNETKEQQG